MRSRLFHAVVAGGLGFGAAAIACSNAEEAAQSAPIASDAEAKADAPSADAAPDAVADAAPDAIADAAYEDSGWHPTK